MMTKTTIRLLKDGNYVGHIYFLDFVKFDHCWTTDDLANYIKDHCDDTIVSYRRFDDEENED